MKPKPIIIIKKNYEAHSGANSEAKSLFIMNHDESENEDDWSETSDEKIEE